MHGLQHEILILFHKVDSFPLVISNDLQCCWGYSKDTTTFPISFIKIYSINSMMISGSKSGTPHAMIMNLTNSSAKFGHGQYSESMKTTENVYYMVLGT